MAFFALSAQIFMLCVLAGIVVGGFVVYCVKKRFPGTPFLLSFLIFLLMAFVVTSVALYAVIITVYAIIVLIVGLITTGVLYLLLRRTNPVNRYKNQ